MNPRNSESEPSAFPAHPESYSPVPIKKVKSKRGRPQKKMKMLSQHKGISNKSKLKEDSNERGEMQAESPEDDAEDFVGKDGESGQDVEDSDDEDSDEDDSDEEEEDEDSDEESDEGGEESEEEEEEEVPKRRKPTKKRKCGSLASTKRKKPRQKKATQLFQGCRPISYEEAAELWTEVPPGASTPGTARLARARAQVASDAELDDIRSQIETLRQTLSAGQAKGNKHNITLQADSAFPLMSAANQVTPRLDLQSSIPLLQSPSAQAASPGGV